MTALTPLGQIANLLGTIRLVALEAIPSGDKVAALQTALYKIHIPSLVQDVVLAPGALEYDFPAAKLLERLGDLGQADRLVGVGLDARLGQRHVRVEHLEEAKGPRKVVDHLESRRVGGLVAWWRQRVDAGGVLVVFMGPEVSVSAADERRPVSVSL